MSVKNNGEKRNEICIKIEKKMSLSKYEQIIIITLVSVSFLRAKQIDFDVHLAKCLKRILVKSSEILSRRRIPSLFHFIGKGHMSGDFGILGMNRENTQFVDKF